jgi:hypothetical protein
MGMHAEISVHEPGGGVGMCTLVFAADRHGLGFITEKKHFFSDQNK